MPLLTIHVIYYRIKKDICTNMGAEKIKLAIRIVCFVTTPMLFLAQKPLVSANDTVPGEGHFQNKTWKKVIERFLTENDISADKIALDKKIS